MPRTPTPQTDGATSVVIAGNPYSGMSKRELAAKLADERDALEEARRASSEAGKVQREHERAIALLNEALAAQALDE